MKLKESLLALLKEADQQEIAYKTLFTYLTGRGYPVLLILLSIPFCLPISIPGLSTSFGLVAAFIGIRIAFGRHFWWPEWLMNKTISRATLERIIQKTIQITDYLQPILHPRMSYLTMNPTIHRLHGLVIFFLSMILAMPIPIPLTNMLPAIPILMISLGLLEDDGLFIIIGYILFLLCIFIFGILFWLGFTWFNTAL